MKIQVSTLETVEAKRMQIYLKVALRRSGRALWVLWRVEYHRSVFLCDPDADRRHLRSMRQDIYPGRAAMSTLPDPLPPGWRWHAMDARVLPSLTNTPPDQDYCVPCGQFVPLEDYYAEIHCCRACSIARSHASRKRRHHGRHPR